MQLYIILLACIISCVEPKCPSNCTCTSSTVSCMNGNLDRIPNFDLLHTFPLVIDLSGNEITTIGFRDLDFENNFIVKEIYLNDTSLIDIEKNAFDTLENLQELYLGNTLLNSVHSNIIEVLSNMVLLDLSGNYFEGDMPVIKSKSLEFLTIIDCQITTITVESLKHLPNLKLLSLQRNNIHQIDINTFESVSNKLFLLKLPYSTWECNCQTMKVFNYLLDNGYIANSEPYECQVNNDFIKIFDSKQQYCASDQIIPTTQKNENRSYIIQKRDEVIEKKSNNVHHTRIESINNITENIAFKAYGYIFLCITISTVVLTVLLAVIKKNVSASDSTDKLLTI